MVILSLLLTSLMGTAIAGERRDLKRMCKAKKKQCRKDGGSRKSCRKVKKQCRKDNKVSFKDDLQNLKQKLQGLAKKIASKVEVTLSEDDNHGEFIELAIHAKALKSIDDFYYYPNQFDSYVSIVDGEKAKIIKLKIYTSDLAQQGIGEELQTSRGRVFPKFINGQRYESLYGEEVKVSGKQGYQVYFDGEKKVVGIFIPSQAVGKGISALNDLKNKSKFLAWMPNINSVPIGIKINKVKVGRVSLLSKDENGENSGVVILFDHAKLKEVVR
ncbi:MAG: hypothetical protein ACI9QD_000322 [Thermoproteota archaeon]|jgi:hypothetical protein